MEVVRGVGDKEGLIEIIKRALGEGKIVVVPTDTVYGLVCDARNARAVRRIFKIKKRPFSNPLPLFVGGIEMAKQIAKVTPAEEKFLRKFWPGKVTFVLQRKGGLPRVLFAGKKTVGLRHPDYKLIQGLFEKIDFPLAQTSANISGRPAPTEIKEVLQQLSSRDPEPDLVIDAGGLKKAKPSTVLDLTSRPPKILREGEIVPEMSF